MDAAGIDATTSDTPLRKRGDSPARPAIRTSRAALFVKNAFRILGETGRTDFTLQELAERSRTSLRAFYQQFDSKEDLLLALFEESILVSTAAWAAEVEGAGAVDSLRTVIERINVRGESDSQDGINRALTAYNARLVETRPDAYLRILAPLRRLLLDILRKGARTGEFRADIGSDAMAVVVLTTVLAASRYQVIGTDAADESPTTETLLAFCLNGLGSIAAS